MRKKSNDFLTGPDRKLPGKSAGLLLSHSKDQGLDAAFVLAVEQAGYSQFLALQSESWHIFVSRLAFGLSDFFNALDNRASPGAEGSIAFDLLSHPAPGAFAREAVQLFRQDALSFTAFFSLIKCLRGTMLNDPVLSVQRQRGCALFFDRLEIVAASQWLKEEARSTQHRLREAKLFILNEKRRYAAIFHRMAEPACIIDHQGCLLDVNAAFADFFKTRGEMLLGKPYIQLFGVEACNICLLDKHLAGHGSFANIEVVIQVAGEIRTVLISGSSLGRVRGVPCGIVILQDVTAQRQMAQAQQELVCLTASLRCSNAELEQFAHVSSHDMKEPLLLIVAFAERLLARWPEKFDGKAGEYLGRILKAAHQLQAFVDDILQLSKVRSEERSFGVVALDELMQEVLGDFEERIRQVQGNIWVGHLATIEGDKIQLRQLFQNLIANALKYRQENLPPMVEVKGRKLPGGIYEITVRDNGIGFEEKYAERIFQPFVRLHGRHEYEGTGIGLATCEKIVARHGGQITAKSSPGEGSVFIVYLPVEQYKRQ
jgi:PAS domain S-box-containing protein